MKPQRHRKSPRLQGYDYSQSGAYFVTICTHQRQHLFGHIESGAFVPTPAGIVAADVWHTIPNRYPDVELDAFVVMPNHVHGIIILTGEESGFRTLLGRVINLYKGVVTMRIRTQTETDMVVWQSRYHDHIIRDEVGLNHIRQYVLHNPQLWSEDRFYSADIS